MKRAAAAPLIPIILAASQTAAAQDAARRDEHQMHGLHRDPKAYIAMLEDPARDAYQKPHEVMAALELEEGETVADIGAGSGYFAFRLAAHVGEKGRVFAVDIDPEMVRHLNRRIRDTGAWNVRTILAAPDDPLLADASVDRFFVCDTWHHIEDQAAYLGRMRKMLRPHGQVIMIDFHKRELPVGPPVSMKIAREDLVRQMEEAGFRLAREHTFLPYQYFLVFAQPPAPGEPPATAVSRSNLGGLFFDPQGADFTPWVNGFKREVYRNWIVPAGALHGAMGRVDVEFAVEHDGTMSGLRLVRSSGVAELDKAAESSLRHSRFPSLPTGFPRERVTMQVAFFYNTEPPGPK